jgi:UDP-N-acetylglucosamine 2-epimerase (non-hydrolysing)
MIRVVNIVGARPNFMKMAPIHRLMQQHPAFDPVLIHTGQHYDERMSRIFFEELQMPQPDLYLGVGSGSHAEQTAQVMMHLEPELLRLRPHLVIVVGDVNSTLAAALTAVKLHIPVAHVEAGLRSFDWTMPEEINRMLTDAISSYLFVTEPSGLENLEREGQDPQHIFFVGNVMIDTLEAHIARAEKHSSILARLGLRSRQYALLTLHRPGNVDHRPTLENILQALKKIQDELPLVFPAHPRTVKNMEHFGFLEQVRQWPNFRLLEPVGYLDFLHLMKHARVVLTDSGGIQEETTVLGVPCLTLRPNTERPITIEMGTNRLVGSDPKTILAAFREAMNGFPTDARRPPKWDGQAARRIVEILAEKCTPQ